MPYEQEHRVSIQVQLPEGVEVALDQDGHGVRSAIITATSSQSRDDATQNLGSVVQKIATNFTDLSSSDRKS